MAVEKKNTEKKNTGKKAPPAKEGKTLRAGKEPKSSQTKQVKPGVKESRVQEPKVLPTPKPVAKPHGQVFVKKMEKSLLDYKSEILNSLISNSNEFKEIAGGLDSKDLADIASDDIDRKMIEALGFQEIKRLRLIEAALLRIKEGKYGFCIKCGKLIPQDRLEAIPYAIMCIECKSEEERRNR